MGKLCYTLLCLFVGITANASQITEQQALQVAAKYADIDIKSHPQRMKAAGMQQKAAAYYAFNIGDNDGFVIVSGDDSLTELVGYSDSGSFDPDNMPDNMRSWLQAYSDYVASVQSGESRSTRREITDEATVIVQPFVTTKWNQREPYNRMTPVDNGQNCVTGCVATAMAQIMNYYEWPERGEGSHSYTDDSGHSLSADFSQSVYDWIKFDSKYCLDIRVANGIVTVAPEYSLSLAKQIEKPEKIYIGQTAEFVATLHNNSSLTAEGTIDYEVRRLSDNGVVYSSSIEAIVYDGNDYSTMLSVPVESGIFDYSETYSIAVTSFTLYSGKTIPVESGFGQCTFLVDCHRLSFYDYKDDCGISLVVDQFKKTEPQDVMFKYVYNIDTRWFNGDISAAICDKNGEIILYFSDYYTLSLNPGGVNNIIRTMENFTPDMSELADGMYSIIPLLRAEGDTEWVRFDHPSKIDIEIKGDYAYVQNYIFCISQESDFTPSGDFNVGDNAMFNVKIRNNGKEQAIGKLHYEIWKQPDNRFVYCDDEQIYIPAYSTEDIVIISNYYTFEEEGTYTIALVSYKPSTDYHHSFSTTYSPYAFNVGEAGVEKIDADSVAVYPNPVEGYVTVECNDVAAVRIYSASGQLVKSVGGTDAEGSIYVGDLPAGYYIVAVETESGATVRKQILKR